MMFCIKINEQYEVDNEDMETQQNMIINKQFFYLIDFNYKIIL